MLIRVQQRERQWRVVHPEKAEAPTFHDGCAAFDFAAALAKEQHARSGESCAVRVEVCDAYVDAAQFD